MLPRKQMILSQHFEFYGISISKKWIGMEINEWHAEISYEYKTVQ